jgi:NitT/TauT family transport system ATP-binding protein
VYLADRVAVMSARPGRVKEIVDTGFAGERDREVAGTREFAEKVEHLWALVRNEAILAEEQQRR